MVWIPLKPLPPPAPPPPAMLGTRYLVACKGDDTVRWGVPNVRVNRQMVRGRVLSSLTMSIRCFGRLLTFTFGTCPLEVSQ